MAISVYLIIRPHRSRRVFVAALSAYLCLAHAATATAQKDSVYLNAEPGNRNSVVRGKVIKTSAFNVTVKTDSGQEEIAASRIRKISFDDEPREIDRARDHLDGGRYDECLATLAKIDTAPDSAFINQQISFLQATAIGLMALRGDDAASLEAGASAVGNFVKSNTDSPQLVVAVDLYGQLLMAGGKLDQAQREFNKLTKSRWERYVTRGHFYEGEALMLQNQLDAAKKSYSELLSLPDDNGESQQFKLLAQCQLARIEAMGGKVDAAIASLQKIIDEENADDSRLFACAYNALGTCYLQAKDLKKARLAFLHTHLLFSAASEAHAESLYQLTKIWTETKDTDRANETRELLTSRYRTSVWASKL